jgi:hypothetical protein
MSSAPSESKKRKVAEVASESQPKAGSATALNRPKKAGKQDPPTQARLTRMARLTRKAQLYQAAMDRFHRSTITSASAKTSKKAVW